MDEEIKLIHIMHGSHNCEFAYLLKLTCNLKIKQYFFHL